VNIILWREQILVKLAVEKKCTAYNKLYNGTLVIRPPLGGVKIELLREVV